MEKAFSHHNHQQCQSSAVSQARELCDKEGVRFTKLREQVFSLIWQSHKPITAYQLLDLIKDGDFSATPPTVYRTLDFLLEQGLIHRINSLNAFIGCCQPGEHHTGTFIICEQCEQAEEVDNDEIVRVIKDVSDHHKFRMKRYVTEIYGLCPQCQSENARCQSAGRESTEEEHQS
ncbi:Fur family transcriptional regulator [Litoribrevibacter albus]|uniref:Transcriptional repressor n=1 Tax=Litoribrevibacter albus TaxID=1473156 RepID=A0AA37W9P7_9GAMM|nr:Fur family transcriptional regulator [Litoribrevibacter albus]GLQ32951.1 transcriptional repressor [Litoribrevibacter albus]